MLVASGVGGGYDTYARAFARHALKHLPGVAAIIANMEPLFGNPGARYDALRLNWLGSIGKLENVCAT
jgi:hypothetical protein